MTTTTTDLHTTVKAEAACPQAEPSADTKAAQVTQPMEDVTSSGATLSPVATPVVSVPSADRKRSRSSMADSPTSTTAAPVTTSSATGRPLRAARIVSPSAEASRSGSTTSFDQDEDDMVPSESAEESTCSSRSVSPQPKKRRRKKVTSTKKTTSATTDDAEDRTFIDNSRRRSRKPPPPSTALTVIHCGLVTASGRREYRENCAFFASVVPLGGDDATISQPTVNVYTAVSDKHRRVLYCCGDLAKRFETTTDSKRMNKVGMWMSRRKETDGVFQAAAILHKEQGPTSRVGLKTSGYFFTIEIAAAYQQHVLASRQRLEDAYPSSQHPYKHINSYMRGRLTDDAKVKLVSDSPRSIRSTKAGQVVESPEAGTKKLKLAMSTSSSSIHAPVAVRPSSATGTAPSADDLSASLLHEMSSAVAIAQKEEDQAAALIESRKLQRRLRERARRLRQKEERIAQQNSNSSKGHSSHDDSEHSQNEDAELDDLDEDVKSPVLTARQDPLAALAGVAPTFARAPVSGPVHPLQLPSSTNSSVRSFPLTPSSMPYSLVPTMLRGRINSPPLYPVTPVASVGKVAAPMPMPLMTMTSPRTPSASPLSPSASSTSTATTIAMPTAKQQAPVEFDRAMRYQAEMQHQMSMQEQKMAYLAHQQQAMWMQQSQAPMGVGLAPSTMSQAPHPGMSVGMSGMPGMSAYGSFVPSHPLPYYHPMSQSVASPDGMSTSNSSFQFSSYSYPMSMPMRMPAFPGAPFPNYMAMGVATGSP